MAKGGNRTQGAGRLGAASERVGHIAGRFLEAMPNPQTELSYTNPFQLVVAVVLSAQCTDKRVNMVTPALFAAYPTPADMAKGDHEAVHTLIASCTYARAKTNYLIGLSEILATKHGGKVPDSREELMELPGVGQKTANVILSVLFGQTTVAVDTHVYRVAHRIGLVEPTALTPKAVEEQLLRVWPEDTRYLAHHWLVLHGRYVCTARSPKCESCLISEWCERNPTKTLR